MCANPIEHGQSRSKWINRKSRLINIKAPKRYCASQCYSGRSFKPGKEDDEINREHSDDEPFSALAFKVVSAPHVGKITYFRVYSGTLSKGDKVVNTTTG